MKALKATCLVTAILFVAPNASAHPERVGCFDTEVDAQQFVDTVRAYDASYHDAEDERRNLLAALDQSYSSLRYYLEGSSNVTFGVPKTDAGEASSEISQYTSHHHLLAQEVVRGEGGQYCSKVRSEIHTFRNVWTVDVKKNLILTSETYTEIAK